MSYVPRIYPDIVRDLLTTLTGGTVQESLLVPAEFDVLETLLLRDRPVRRVSHLQGTVEVGVAPNTTDIDYRFTAADFELVSLTGVENEFDAIRFRNDAQLPKPNTLLSINYYPIETRPVPITDLNVGSVARTLLETIANEMTMGYLNLDFVYKSAYLDTAEGNSLDKVVALVGVKRLPAGSPLVKVRFTRQAGNSGRISVPAGTSVTDADGSRYLTLSTLTLEPGETTRDVLTGGESLSTKLVEQGELDRLEILVAGISSVSNPEPARQQNSPETDETLRRRTRTALSGSIRGTVNALEFAVRSIPGVREVSIVERPNGTAGEIKIEVAYDTDTEEVRSLVENRIDEYRPAGIRVITAQASRKDVTVNVELTLAGSRLSDNEFQLVKTGIEQRLVDYLESLPPDGMVRPARMTALIMQDERVIDATATLSPDVAGQVLDAVVEVNSVSFGTPEYELSPAASPATTADITIDLPILLVTGTSEDQAKDAIEAIVITHLASRNQAQPLTVNNLLDSIRNDSLFAAVRAEALVTVEDSGGLFQQLSDDLNSYTPTINETLQLVGLNLDLREGSI